MPCLPQNAKNLIVVYTRFDFDYRQYPSKKEMSFAEKFFTLLDSLPEWKMFEDLTMIFFPPLFNTVDGIVHYPLEMALE